MQETQQQTDLRKEAIAFAEWIVKNRYISKGLSNWFLSETSEYISSEQLYSLFKNKP